MSRGVLALDLGTTSVRALLVGADGGVRARAQRPLGVSFPAPGRVEQDPVETWEHSREVLCEVLARSGVGAGDVAGLGVVTQRSTALCWDAESGEPLAPALGWQDARTAPRVRELRAAGIPINTLASATKLAWLVEHVPAVSDAARAGRLRFGTPDTWLTWCLTDGEAHVTDPGNASCTALFDPSTGDWAGPLLQLFGVPAEPLPRIVGTSQVVAETPAKLLGAPVPVAARAGDQQAASFAQGVHAAGLAKLTLGTSAMLDLHVGDAPQAPPPGSYALCLWRLGEGPRAYCLEGTVITAGAAVDWLAELGLAADAQELDRLAREVESSGGVSFVPALQGLGTPFLEGGARGRFAGLTRGSGRRELARAALEGVAHRCVDLCDALAFRGPSLRVDGGLARSGFLLQRLADLAGCELLRADEVETTALGAAFLAGLATGVFADPAQCRECVPPPRRVEPGPAAETRASDRAAWQRALARAREE